MAQVSQRIPGFHDPSLIVFFLRRQVNQKNRSHDDVWFSFTLSDLLILWCLSCYTIASYFVSYQSVNKIQAGKVIRAGQFVPILFAFKDYFT